MTSYVPFFEEYPASTKALGAVLYQESNQGVTCAVCGRRPCLRVVGSKAFCSCHSAEAWAEAARVMGKKGEV